MTDKIFRKVLNELAWWHFLDMKYHNRTTAQQIINYETMLKIISMGGDK